MTRAYCPEPRRERRVWRVALNALGELAHGGLFLAALVLALSVVALVFGAPGGVYISSADNAYPSRIEMSEPQRDMKG